MEAATTQRQQQPNQQFAEEAALAALVVVLLSGLPVLSIAALAVPILQPLGLKPDAIRRAVGLLVPHAEGAEAAMLGAEGWVQRTTAARQAAYIRNAAGRLSVDPQALDAERRHLRQHLNAERNRRGAARQVDRAVGRYGQVLGWYNPSTTHLACKQMVGKNFNVERPPIVDGHAAYPGAVHPFCACFAGPPHPDAELVR